MGHWREQGLWSSTFVFWFVIIAVCIGGLSFTSIYLRPYWLGLERKAYTASHQYIEAQRTKILTLVANYGRAAPVQRAAIRDQITQAARQIPPHEVPSSARRIMNEQ